MNRRRRVVLATAAAGLARAGSAWSQAPARMVRIGWISSNAWPNSQPSPPMGYSGQSTQMSTLMGTIMAEVMDGCTERNPWKDFAWPAIPGHFGRPWSLPLVGAYYRLKDKLA